MLVRLAFLLICCTPCWANPQLNSFIKEAQRENASSINQISTERKSISQELHQVQKTKHHLEQQKLNLEIKIKALKAEKEALVQQSLIRQRQSQELASSLREAASTLLMDLNLSFQSTATDRKQLDKILDKQNLNEPPVFQVVQIAIQQVLRGRKVEQGSGSYYDENGLLRQAEWLRCGSLDLWFKDQHKVGRLHKVENSSHPHIDTRYTRDSDDLQRLFNSDLKSGWLLIDPSGGEALLQDPVSKGFGAWFRSGGLLAWPIFFMAFIAIVLIIERLLFLYRIEKDLKQLAPPILQSIAQGNRDQALKTIQTSNGVFSRICGAGLLSQGSHEDCEKSLEEAILVEIPLLERSLNFLGVIAATAPLLGLLGTVSGMIAIFQVITHLGNSEPKLMSGGIAQALVTTQMGLVVAVPCMIVHSLISGRVDHLLHRLENFGNQFVQVLSKRKKT